MSRDDDKSLLQEFLPLDEKPDGRKLGLCRGLDEDGNPAQGVSIIGPAPEGKPITSDLYRFEQVEGSPALKATRVFKSPHKGPAWCATPEFRDNFEETFGKKESAGEPDPSTLN